MSSTSNVQNLLVNVVRPTYKWEAGTGFVPSVTLSNITELIAGKVKTDALVVSDSNVNTFIGSNAGCNAVASSNNVGIGFQALGGVVNADCNVAVGALALNGFSNGSNNTVIGAGADINAEGDSNIILGTNTTITNGSNSIIIGNGITWGNGNYINIGGAFYSTNGFVGIRTAACETPFHVAGLSYFEDKVGIQVINPTYSLDVLGTAYATTRFLTGPGSSPTTPAYSFCNVATTGLYQTSDASYGSGALGMSVLGRPRLVVSGTKTYIYGDLDVCGALSAVSGGGGGGGGGTIASNGTAAAPSFTFSNDLSTGLHLAGTSTLAFDTSGVQRMCISGGFVGIGTANPVVRLEVVGDISATTYNGPGGTESAPHYTFSDDRTTGVFFPGANIVGFTTGGQERMRITNGTIGIGTTTSSANLLDVNGPMSVIGATGTTTITGDLFTTPNIQASGAYQYALSNTRFRYNVSKASASPNYGLCYATNLHGSDIITYTADTTNGDSFTVSLTGYYAINVVLFGGGAISVDSLASDVFPTTSSYFEGLAPGSASGASGASFVLRLSAYVTYRVKTSGALDSGTWRNNAAISIAPIYHTYN